ncbi:MAG TPA: ester cyclase, partial [Chloroflexi bacterium]|nr:ester cyclase [Chloroflexota bacterium]
DCIYRSPGYPEYHGPEGFRDRVQSVRSAFPDIHIIIQDIIAEGDIVMERYTLTGTHR